MNPELRDEISELLKVIDEYDKVIGKYNEALAARKNGGVAANQLAHDIASIKTTV